MDDYKNYLKEVNGFSDNEDLLNEMSYYVSKNVKEKLNSIPLVTKKVFVEEARPGDIIVAFTANKALKGNFKAKVFAKLMASMQGSPYTSSKVVLDNGNVGGYGIVVRPSYFDENIIEQFPLKQAVRARSEMCLIRVVNTTTAQRNKAQKYIQSKMGLGYSDLDMYKTIWNRMVNRKIFHFFKDRSLDKKQLNAIQGPLFCSTIISIAYLTAGYKTRFNGVHPYDVWPKDFILDQNTEKVCRIDY